MDEGFLTTEEVLDYLHVNLRTVYRLIKAGKIPAVRVGRQWRFRKRDIDTWLENQRPRTQRPAPPRTTTPPPAPARPNHDARDRTCAHPRGRRRGHDPGPAAQDVGAGRIRRGPCAGRPCRA